MKPISTRGAIACFLAALLVAGTLALPTAAFASAVAQLETESPVPAPEDDGSIVQPEPGEEESVGEGSAGEEPAIVQTATPEVTEESQTTPPEESTRSDIATETTGGAEATPTLPGSETTLPFTGGRPIGFWVLGTVLGLAGVGTLMWPTLLRKRGATQGAAGVAERAWVRRTAGTVLLVAGIGVALYPSLTDVRFFMLQRAMAAEGSRDWPQEAVARLIIPDIGLDAYVLEGTDSAILDRAPGHYPGTPLPGERGNSAIAGHRTMYGHPFNRLDEVRPGAEIITYTPTGKATYRVVSVAPVSPTAVEVAGSFGDDRLTLTTCHPIGSARQRLVVAAELVE